MDQDRFDVFVGLDVGKEHHHATALNSAGRRLHDKALPQDEAALREVFDKLTVHGSVLVIVDQPATIGALPVTVARAMGIEVAYLPGLAMRRIADLHPGNAKTDARDAYIIAEAGRTMPHALRRAGLMPRSRRSGARRRTSARSARASRARCATRSPTARP